MNDDPSLYLVGYKGLGYINALVGRYWSNRLQMNEQELSLFYTKKVYVHP